MYFKKKWHYGLEIFGQKPGYSVLAIEKNCNTTYCIYKEYLCLLINMCKYIFYTSWQQSLKSKYETCLW